MGILGPSGAGKSSIFKMVTMSMNRTGGKIELLGRDFTDPRVAADELTRGQIGIVYQDDVMWQELTVDENLRYIGRLKGLSEPEIVSQLDIVKNLLGLQKHSNKKAFKLSGGNKRKLCSALALMKTPELIFMDEVSNGVDPISRKNLYSYLKKLRFTSTLLITHRIDEAEKICDKIAIMADGLFLDCDDPKNLKEKHGQVYILQVEPTVATSMSIQKVHERITSSLDFCKRIYAIQEEEDQDESNELRPILTYRFDEVDNNPIKNRISREINMQPTGNSSGSFLLNDAA